MKIPEKLVFTRVWKIL